MANGIFKVNDSSSDIYSIASSGNSGASVNNIVNSLSSIQVQYPASGILIKRVSNSEYLLVLNMDNTISSISYVKNSQTYTVNKSTSVVYSNGESYSWTATAATGYHFNSSNTEVTKSGSGTMTISGVAVDLSANVNTYNLSLKLGTGIQSIYYSLNDSSYTQVTSSKSISVEHFDVVKCYATVEHDGTNPDIYYYGDYTEESPYVINVTPTSRTQSYSYNPAGTLRLPQSVVINGSLSNEQFITKQIDGTGLSYTAIYNVGPSEDITSYTDYYKLKASTLSTYGKWGAAIGSQNLVIQYTLNSSTAGGTTVVDVQALRVNDSLNNIWMVNASNACVGIYKLNGTSVVIPDGCTINGSSLSGEDGYLKGVKSLEIRNGIDVPASAFANCTTLESVVFKSASAFTIGVKAFNGCSNLSTLDFLSCGNNFINCTIGDNSRDVWTGCKLRTVKITQGNFASINRIYYDNTDDYINMRTPGGQEYKWWSKGTSDGRDTYCYSFTQNRSRVLFMTYSSKRDSSVQTSCPLYGGGNGATSVGDDTSITNWSLKSTGLWNSSSTDSIRLVIGWGLNNSRINYRYISDEQYCGYQFTPNGHSNYDFLQVDEDAKASNFSNLDMSGYVNDYVYPQIKLGTLTDDNVNEVWGIESSVGKESTYRKYNNTKGGSYIDLMIPKFTDDSTLWGDFRTYSKNKDRD